MPQFDVTTYAPQLVWLVITFAVLFAIMWKVAVPRIADVLEARQKRIDDNLNKAAELKKEAEAAMEAYEKAIADAREEAHSVINEAAAKLSEEASEREEALNADLARRIKEGEAAIDKARQDAMSSIRDTAVEAAAAAVEKVLGEVPDQKNVGSAVDQVMKARD